MKILYDHQIFSLQKVGGISRYFSELISHLNDKTIELELPIKNSQNIYIKKNTIYKRKLFNRFIKSKNIYTNNSILAKEYLQKSNFDIFHPTYYDPYFLEYIKDKKFVLTIHDMIHELYSSDFPENIKDSVNKKLLAHKATKIIAVSKNTKDDIIKLFGIDKDKIEVVYHGISKFNHYKTVKNIPDKFLLFVGRRDLYKNFNTFIDGIANILKTNDTLFLVSVGGGQFTNEELLRIKNLGINDKVIQIDATDAELIYLYKNAEMFIFPSYYEGFGIPLLEAFSLGCPVIASNSSSLIEIGDDAAAFFSPDDKDSINETVSKILTNKDDRSKLINLGYKRVKDFNWGKTALLTKKVYESIL